MQIPNKVVDLIFPEGISDWFEIKEGHRGNDGTETHITLQEKDIPPFTEQTKSSVTSSI